MAFQILIRISNVGRLLRPALTVQFFAEYSWGTDTTGRNSDVAVRQAYIDWIIPNTNVKVRMGKQLIGLPNDASGKNAIFHPWASRDGISLDAPVTDWMSLNVFWMRGNYVEHGEYCSTDESDKSDFFGLVANMNFDGFSVSPYLMYATLDDGAAVPGSTDSSFTGVDKDGKDVAPKADGNAFWAGVSSTMTYFDPFVLKLSGAYGVASYDSEFKVNDRAGWYVQAKGSYKTAYGTPILLA